MLSSACVQLSPTLHLQAAQEKILAEQRAREMADRQAAEAAKAKALKVKAETSAVRKALAAHANGHHIAKDSAAPLAGVLPGQGRLWCVPEAVLQTLRKETFVEMLEAHYAQINKRFKVQSAHPNDLRWRRKYDV